MSKEHSGPPDTDESPFHFIEGDAPSPSEPRRPPDSVVESDPGAVPILTPDGSPKEKGLFVGKRHLAEASSAEAMFDGDGFLVKEEPPVDKFGLPFAPGTDGRDERHPFGFLDENDPEHDQMMGEVKLPTVMNLECLAGCRHYREVILEEPTADETQWSVVRRICRYYQDHESDWDLSEETIYACSAFDPHPLSLRGNLRRLVSWTELALARDELSPDIAWHFPETTLAQVTKQLLRLVGLYPDRKGKVAPASKKLAPFWDEDEEEEDDDGRE